MSAADEKRSRLFQRELLLEEKSSLEAWLRQCFSWILAMGSLELTYVGVVRALAPSLRLLLVVPFLLTICVVALGIYGLKVERRIDRIRALLRDEQSLSRGLMFFALVYGFMCSIIALVMVFI